jgi:hypothetical protein
LGKPNYSFKKRQRELEKKKKKEEKRMKKLSKKESESLDSPEQANSGEAEPPPGNADTDPT